MKYKVGDRVVVLEDLELLKDYYNENGAVGEYSSAVGSMCELRGKVVTIASVSKYNAYRIIEDDTWWRDTMFEGKEQDLLRDTDSNLIKELYK